MMLDSLHTYPVKQCYRVDHDVARVDPWGLAGDRRWLVIDTDGEPIAQPEMPRISQIRALSTPDGLLLRAEGHPDQPVTRPSQENPITLRWRGGTTVTEADQAAHDWLSRVLDRKARLVRFDDPPVGYRHGGRPDSLDQHPLLLTTLASLDSLNGWLLESGSPEGPLPMTRFRPNVVVAGAQPWAEDGWIGRGLRIGEVDFDVYKACDRCVITTVDQETGERGHEPLRTLAKHRNIDRKLLFGVYLAPAGTGRIAVGDPVTPL
jgi:uncharacterized protein YcbX